MSNFFNFKGRTNRLNYFIALCLITFISYSSDIIVENTSSTFLYVILIIFNIIAVAKYICITIQRFHDIGRSGRHFWLFLIPIYNIYLELVLLFKKGTDGNNKFGDDPLFVDEQ